MKSIKEIIEELSALKAKHLRVDHSGKLLDSWPGGFFEESFNELF